MNFENITYRVDEEVAWLTLNRPDKLNALVGNVREEIFNALDLAAKDDNVRVLVITGAGKGFCAGGDIQYMSQLLANNDTAGFQKLLEQGRRVVEKIRAIEKPVIAMINGAAAGAGLNLALACDIRIASDNAKFSQAFAKIGLHPDWGGSFFLPRLVGTANACELIFTGDMIDAESALRMGLINRVVALTELEKVTREMLAKLVRRPRQALALAKKAIYQGIQYSLTDALDYETAAQLSCFQSDDAKEGINAFLERREAKFN